MKKHILFILENSVFPFDVRVRSEALAAKRYGFDVSVISTGNELAKKNYEIYNGIEIYRHKRTSIAKGKLRFISEYMNAFFWEFLLSLKIYRKKPFHIIHAANPPDHIFIIALFYKLFGVKFIFDHHDLTPELYLTHFSGHKDFMFRILYLLEKLSCKLADAVISTNISYQRVVNQRHNINSEKIFIVRNDPAAHDDLFKTINKNINVNGKKVLLFLGGINAQDGVDVLLKSLYHLVNDLNESNFICKIVGGGDALPAAKNIARDLQLEPYVDFKGWITDKKRVKEYLSSAHICMEPAPYNELNRHSTFIKIMEYMSAGKPIVAFDLKETRYSAKNAALYIKPEDSLGFAAAVKKLMDEPVLRDKLGSAGEKRIKERLNWKNASLNLENAYKYIQ